MESSVYREVSKAGWLQEKIRKKKIGPTRKMRTVYKEAQWVILCVHNDHMPHLEWYPCDQGVAGHRPVRVLDLFECAFVSNVMEDDRSFLISFKDSKRQQIEFAALSQVERREWTSMLIFTLTRLNCLDVDTNLYSPLPVNSALSSTLTEAQNLLDDSPPSTIAPIAPRLSFPVPAPNLLSTNAVSVISSPRPITACLDQSVPLLPQNQLSFVIDRNEEQEEEEVEEDEDSENYEHIIRGIHLISDDSSAVSSQTDLDVCNDEEQLATGVAGIDVNILSEEGKSAARKSSSQQKREKRVSCAVKRRTVSTCETSIAHSLQNEKLQSMTLTKKAPQLPPRDPLNSCNETDNTTVASEKHYDIPVGHVDIDQIYDQLPALTSSSSSPKRTNQKRHDRKDSLDILDVVVESVQSKSLSSVSPYENCPSSPQVAFSSTQIEIDEDHYHSPPPFAQNTAPTFAVSNRQQLSRYHSATSPPPLPPRNSSCEPSNNHNNNNTSPVPSSNKQNYYDTVAYTDPSSRQCSDCIKQEILTSINVELFVSQKDCVQNLALVEIGKSIWIAGWTSSADKRLSGLIHIGDRVVSVNGTKIDSVGQLPTVFYEVNIPGAPNVLLIERLPHAQVHLLPMSTNSPSIGITFEKGKPKISSIENGSEASANGLKSTVKSFVDCCKEVAAVVTEINGQSLNLFGKNGEALERLKSVFSTEQGYHNVVIIQPYDFIKIIRTQLKAKKNYKQYLAP